MYTTYSIENLNRQYRKVAKNKASFPTDESLMKLMYLVTINVTKKWDKSIKNWNTILGELSIQFHDRLNII